MSKPQTPHGFRSSKRLKSPREGRKIDRAFAELESQRFKPIVQEPDDITTRFSSDNNSGENSCGKSYQKIIADFSYTNGGHSLEPPKSVKSYENIFVGEYQVWDE